MTAPFVRADCPACEGEGDNGWYFLTGVWSPCRDCVEAPLTLKNWLADEPVTQVSAVEYVVASNGARKILAMVP